MKNYSNGMKATEFNRTQIEELSHKITIERWFFNHLEKMAKYYGYDDSKSVERFEQDVLRALETESIIDAQKIINRLAEQTISSYGLKRDELDRTPSTQEFTDDEATAKIMKAYPECSINFTEAGCEFKFKNTARAKVYNYAVANEVELAKKLRLI